MTNLINLLFENQPGDRLAIVHGDNSINYQQLRTKILQAVSWFQQQGTNLRVAVHSQDSIAWVVAIVGSIASGNLTASVPTRGDPRHKLDEFDPDIVLSDDNIHTWYQQLENFPESVLVTVDPDQPCMLLNSGGTTRASRYIIHSTTSMQAKLHLARKTLLDEHCAGQSVLVAAPLFSSYGTVNALMTLQVGATLIIMKNFRPDHMVDLINRYKINYFGATPVVYSMMLKYQLSFQHHPQRSIVVGDFVTRQLIQRWEAQHQHRLVHGFGTSEAGMIFIATSDTPIGALGQPTVDIQLIDGQLWIKSASNMIGVWPYVTRDQWINTGDILKQEKGQYYFVGRAGESFKIDGREVDVASIEQTVLDSGLIEDLVAVPAYDHQDRAHIKLLVVGEQSNQSQLESYLQKFNLKAHIEHVAEIPRSPSGKKVRVACRL
jgi:acyl-CoA synthetase (AMP-forming)/AMP-acid ligase II